MKLLKQIPKERILIRVSIDNEETLLNTVLYLAGTLMMALFLNMRSLMQDFRPTLQTLIMIEI